MSGSYYKVEVGIYCHGNTYRAVACGQTTYHTTKKAARAWRKETKAVGPVRGGRPPKNGRPHRPGINYVKRSDAGSSDLPIGITEQTQYKRLNNGMLSECNVIIAVVSDCGIIVSTFSRTYGESRSRRAAVREVEQMRNEFERYYFS